MDFLGKYYPVQSFWHTLDPRSKISISIVIMIAACLLKGLGVIFLFVMLLLMYFTAKLPFKILWGNLTKFKWLLLITFLANILFPLSELINTFELSFLRAFMIIVRLGLILAIALWINFVTKPAILIDGIVKLCKPLGLFKIPLGDLTLVMSLALRFIPELLTASENIRISQRIRGVSGKIALPKLNAWVKSYYIPLFLASFRRSAIMATAMYVRGYHPGKPRSCTEELNLGISDYFIITGSGLFLVVSIGWTLLRKFY
jgi:energy-coupling factor transport system permease protein